jgi:hypothetical protein
MDISKLTDEEKKDILNQIAVAVLENPNDSDLGKKVRLIILSLK